MKRIGTLTFMLSAALLAVGCSDMAGLPSDDAEDIAGVQKICNVASSQSGTVLMVYASDDVEAVIAAAGAVSGVLHVTPLFNMETGDVELKRRLGLDRWLAVEFAEDYDVEAGAAALASLACVSSVEFNASVERCSDWRSWPYEPGPATRAIAAAGFNDPYRVDQWGFENTGDKGWCPTARVGADINVSRAWSLCAGNPEVVVAVIDEAVQCDHPDLAANIWTNPGEIAGNGTDDDRNGYRDDIHGYNFVDGTPNLDWKSDGNSGHGTHVAGTVAAVNNNGVGVCGVAGGSGRGDGVKIMSCQIFNQGKSTVSGVVNAFEYAADNGACIAQCSFGITSGSVKSEAEYARYGYRAEIDAIRYFLAKSNCSALDGGVAIFASGNDGKAMSGYPAALNDCISVCAVGADGLPGYYTNYGYGCNISAPGGDYYAGGKTDDMKGGILSTMPTESIVLWDENGRPTGDRSAANYGYMQGTSMACPHVSGVAALGLSYALKQGLHYTNDEFKSILLSSVSRIDNRLNGTKRSLVGTSIGNIMLNPYKGQMGSGVTDVWRLYMQMDGVPSVMAETGKSQRIDISEYFGGGAPDLYYPDGAVEVSTEDSEALGLAETPKMAYGKLRIYPTKSGCARITVHAVAGSTLPDGEDGLPGGIVMTRTISIISRPALSDNGGWF